MDDQDIQRQIQEIRDRIYFSALRMFNRPLTVEDLAKLEQIAAEFEEAVFSCSRDGKPSRN